MQTSIDLARSVFQKRPSKRHTGTLHAGMYTSLKLDIVMTHDRSNNFQEQLNSILDWNAPLHRNHDATK